MLDALRRTLMTAYALACRFWSAVACSSWFAAVYKGLAPSACDEGAERPPLTAPAACRQRMPVRGGTHAEMADLAETLNQMLERLEDDVQATCRSSASDLAHELRTPLSNLLTQTQVDVGDPARERRYYREILASNAEELQRLGPHGGRHAAAG
ncbi:MAG: hypothetical protein KatS3mg122_1090 [Caldimonas sp.]|nr:MAG: hypothetical protein KatS3mg122_1090 [Caldimonas sp.]